MDIDGTNKDRPMPALERTCRECGGRGHFKSVGELIECYECDGAGHIPTKAGMRILKLIRHNIRFDDENCASWRES